MTNQHEFITPETAFAAFMIRQGAQHAGFQPSRKHDKIILSVPSDDWVEEMKRLWIGSREYQFDAVRKRLVTELRGRARERKLARKCSP